MPDGRPRQSVSFSPRTRPGVPPIHHSVTYYLDDESYTDVQVKRRKARISDGMIRLSCGIEPVSLIVDDLRQALAATQ